MSDELPRKAGVTGLLPGTGGGPFGAADDESGAGNVALRVGKVGGAVGVLSPESIAGLFAPELGGVR